MSPMRAGACLLSIVLAGCACNATVAGSRDASARDDTSSGPRCTEGDTDGDGWGGSPTCADTERDCDETNRAIHPGAYEACNSIDEDCDGTLDEDLGERSCAEGTCIRRIPACAAGRPAVCPAPDPTMPCETGIDGGPPPPPPPPCAPQAESVGTTYTTMAGHHPPCDGAGQRFGPDCNAAIHRFCSARDCPTSGFGPVENSGDNLTVACVSADADFMVPYATLAASHPSCDGATMRLGDGCNSAIHRYCMSLGYASGFGPVELGPDFVLLTCVRAPYAEAISTTYTVLATHHAPCNGTGEAIGPNCNAAIHRFCASLGRASGYGPVEHGGDGAVVVCVQP